MNQEQIAELEEWAATRLMGFESATLKVTDHSITDNAWAEKIGENIVYHWKRHWHPADDGSEPIIWNGKNTGQIWMCVEKFRSLGWKIEITAYNKGPYVVVVTLDDGSYGILPTFIEVNNSFHYAALLAMRAALDGEGKVK